MQLANQVLWPICICAKEFGLHIFKDYRIDIQRLWMGETAMHDMAEYDPPS